MMRCQTIICFCFILMHLQEAQNSNWEREAQNKVEQHDYIFDTIPSTTYRTCLRYTMLSLYHDSLAEKEKNRQLKLKIDELVLENNKLRSTSGPLANPVNEDTTSLIIVNDASIECTKQLISCQQDLIKSIKDFSACESNLISKNNSLTVCMKYVRRVNLHVWLDLVEFFTFPAWLRTSTMDRFERWAFAIRFVDGINIKRILDLWNKGFQTEEGEEPKKLPIEILPYAMSGIHKMISQTVHLESDLSKKPVDTDEIRQTCKEIDQTLEIQLGCKVILEAQPDSSDFPTQLSEEDYIFMYGRIHLCGDAKLAKTRIEQLLSVGKSAGMKFYDSDVGYIYNTHNPLSTNNKSKPDFVGFKLKCSKEYKSDILKEYFMGVKGSKSSKPPAFTRSSKQTASTGSSKPTASSSTPFPECLQNRYTIWQDQDNQNAQIEIMVQI